MYRTPSTIAADDVKFPSRVIRLTLMSEQAVATTSTSVSWLLNFSQIGKLKPGTIMIVRDIWQVPAIEAGTFVDFTISGVPINTIRTDSADSSFRFPAFARTGATATVYAIPGTAPLAATLAGNAIETFSANRLTLSRVSQTGGDWSTSALRLGIMLVEPGARLS